MSYTRWLQEHRFTVVEVDPAARRLRLRGLEAACRDVACDAHTLVVAEDGQATDLGGLNPGDIVTVEPAADRLDRVVVVRRVWDEITSPEF